MIQISRHYLTRTSSAIRRTRTCFSRQSNRHVITEQCRSVPTSVAYLGFYEGGGANFPWPLLLTQRGHANRVSYFFPMAKTVLFCQRGHGAMPLLNTPLPDLLHMSWLLSFTTTFHAPVCCSTVPNTPRIDVSKCFRSTSSVVLVLTSAEWDVNVIDGYTVYYSTSRDTKPDSWASTFSISK